MTIDFAGLPPEVTSGLVYSGPGSSSLVAAASAWNALAAELSSTAQSYDTVVAQLAGEEWLGPASASMAQAVQPYVDWMTTTASQAAQTSVQATSAAAAFETVFASVVPPPMIAANRAELAQAVSFNIFGQYNNLIAQLEAQYGEFWSQNTSALYNYATSSAVASKLSTFTNAPSVANPAASSSQAGAVSAAAATPAESIQQQLQDFFNSITAQLNKLGTQTGVNQAVTGVAASNPWLLQSWFLLTGQTVLPTNIGTMLNGVSPYTGFFYNTEGLPYFSVGMGNFGTQIAKSAGWLGGAAPAAAAAVPKPPISGALGAAGGQVAAGLGNGAHVGHLAVPASWPGANAAPAVRPAVEMVSEPITAPAGTGAGNVLSGMPVAGTGAGRGAGAGPRYGFKPTVVARPLSAG